MEFKLCALLLLAACSYTTAYPANDKELVDEQIDFVPLEANHRPNFHIPSYFDEELGDVDDDETGYFSPSFNPFTGLYSSLEAMMRSMREQLAFILNNLPERSNRTEEAFPGLGIFGNVDLGKGNTTSVTKVIDGHKVQINETQYENKDGNGGSFYKVRIINVLPESEETSNRDEVVKPTEAPREIESVEDSVENEIAKGEKEGSSRYEHIEIFDEVDSYPSNKNLGEWDDVEWSKGDNSIQNIVDNDIDGGDNFRDLSNDIYVNQLMAEAGAPTNPDAEYFEIVDRRTPYKLP